MNYPVEPGGSNPWLPTRNSEEPKKLWHHKLPEGTDEFCLEGSGYNNSGGHWEFKLYMVRKGNTVDMYAGAN